MIYYLHKIIHLLARCCVVRPPALLRTRRAPFLIPNHPLRTALRDLPSRTCLAITPSPCLSGISMMYRSATSQPQPILLLNLESLPYTSPSQTLNLSAPPFHACAPILDTLEVLSFRYFFYIFVLLDASVGTGSVQMLTPAV
jgi:hypothetical protein